ncbi:gustatory receptor 68a-like [Zootermopsis nevadensis]|uniref:gustatory receptor 68a-like n=1 Tax=Zootermopsis nevadensis TaxID=136037 RepID=UPI000B8E8D28|nr:gustatory receptor 68a-like [Zootermopsis nevadensis]
MDMDVAIFARNNSSAEFQQQLHKLRCLNDILSDVVSSVNSAYGLQILLSTAMNFMSVTTSLYFGIGFAKRLQEDEGFQVKHTFALILSLIWAAVGIFRIVMMSSSCNAASGEASQTSVLLHKLLLKSSLHPDTVTEIQLFLQQVRNRPVKFTASEFFTLGHSTLCSFTAAVATYLVILLQFHS